MSTETFMTSRRAVPVDIGSLKLYCEEMSISGKRVIAETSTVSGDDTVTNTSPRNDTVVLKGRIFDEEAPLHPAAMLDSLLRSSTLLTVEYRGLYLSDCRILSFAVSDTGRDFLDVTVTLSSGSISETEG